MVQWQRQRYQKKFFQQTWINWVVVHDNATAKWFGNRMDYYITMKTMQVGGSYYAEF